MTSTFTTASSSLFPLNFTSNNNSPSSHTLQFALPNSRTSRIRIRAYSPSGSENGHIAQKLKSYAGAAILVGAAAAMIWKSSQLPARSESPPVSVTQQAEVLQDENNNDRIQAESSLSEFLEIN